MQIKSGQVALAVLWATVSGGCAVARDSMARDSWSGAFSLADREQVVIANDAAEWERLWALAGEQPPARLPAATLAVGVFLGQRRSGGYRVSDLALKTEDGKLQVTYGESVPGEGSAVTMAITSPYLIRLFPHEVVRRAP